MQTHAVKIDLENDLYFIVLINDYIYYTTVQNEGAHPYTTIQHVNRWTRSNKNHVSTQTQFKVQALATMEAACLS